MPMEGMGGGDDEVDEDGDRDDNNNGAIRIIAFTKTATWLIAEDEIHHRHRGYGGPNV